MANTTLAGVSQLQSDRSKLWKLFWLIFILAGLTMGLYQSSGVIQDYRNQALTQRITFRDTTALPFPAVTICDNILVRKNNSTKEMREEEISEWVNGEAEKYQEDLMEEEEFQFRKQLYHQKLLMSGDMSRQLDKMQDSIEYFVWKDDTRWMNNFNNADLHDDRPTFESDVWYEFTHPYFGACLTFNPGFKNVQSAGGGSGITLRVKGQRDIRSHPLNSDYAALLIHPPGTAPVMDESNIIQVVPGKNIQVGLSLQRTIHRNTRRQTCISKDNEVDYRDKLAFYTPETPYIYSENLCRESCRAQALWTDNGNFLGTVLPMPSMNLSDMEEFCMPHFLCDLLLPESCDCPPPCSSMSYNLNTNIVNGQTLARMSRRDFEARLTGNYTQQKWNMTRIRKMVDIINIRVYFETHTYKTVVEEPKYSDADFWGMIGGNINLWVGICLVSVAEIFELFTNLIILSVKKWMTCKENPRDYK